MAEIIEGFDNEIKAQYARIFIKTDWRLFKSTAEFYFRRSALLTTSEIKAKSTQRLLLRNIQKRLFLGIAGELITKSVFLKKGYYINKPVESSIHKGYVHEIGSIKSPDLKDSDTFSFSNLTDNIHKVHDFSNLKDIKKALTIMRVFRNKEGHVVTSKHSYDPDTYKAIEEGIKILYKDVFLENLSFKIKMRSSDTGVFSIHSR